MGHQDESVMRTLSTETALTTGEAVPACREMRREKQDELLFTRNSSPQVLACNFGVDSCHHLNLENFLSDHQLLHSWRSVSSRHPDELGTCSPPTKTGHV